MCKFSSTTVEFFLSDIWIDFIFIKWQKFFLLSNLKALTMFLSSYIENTDAMCTVIYFYELLKSFKTN